jgi:hypothetical protein
MMKNVEKQKGEDAKSEPAQVVAVPANLFQ